MTGCDPCLWLIVGFPHRQSAPAHPDHATSAQVIYWERWVHVAVYLSHNRYPLVHNYFNASNISKMAVPVLLACCPCLSFLCIKVQVVVSSLEIKRNRLFFLHSILWRFGQTEIREGRIKGAVSCSVSTKWSGTKGRRHLLLLIYGHF